MEKRRQSDGLRFFLYSIEELMLRVDYYNGHKRFVAECQHTM